MTVLDVPFLGSIRIKKIFKVLVKVTGKEGSDYVRGCKSLLFLTVKRSILIIDLFHFFERVLVDGRLTVVSYGQFSCVRILDRKNQDRDNEGPTFLNPFDNS